MIIRPAITICALSALLATTPLYAQGGGAERAAEPTELIRGAYLISAPVGNLILLLGDDGPVVVGMQHPLLVARARQFLQSRHAPPVRYALITSADSAVERGDPGWGLQGAMTVAHEALRNKIRFTLEKDTTARHRFPKTGFSEVYQLAIDSDEIHMVHQPAAYSDADVIVHFEERKFIYLGNLFTSDGYPSINLDRGGSITGLITAAQKFLDMWGENPTWVEPIVPGRGPIAKLSDLRDFQEMLVAVRDHVLPMVRDGKTRTEVIAARPTAEFDERWGKGPTTPDQFVSMVYQSIARELRASNRRSGTE